MRTAGIVPWLALAGAMAAVTLVFFAAGRSPTAPARVVHQLGELRTLDARLNENVLRARQELLPNYDPLVADITRGRAVLAAIEEGLADDGGVATTSLGSHLRDLRATFGRRAVLLEDFKSDNAVLQNSVHYFELLSEQLMRRLDDADAADAAVVRQVHELRDMVLAYLTVGGTERRREAQAHGARLAGMDLGVSTRAAEPIRLLARHASSILEYRHRVDHEVERFLALALRPTLDEVERLYLAARFAAAEEAERTRLLLFAAALGLLAWLGIALYRLRATTGALRHAKERAEQADRGKTAFLAHVSHELRTPLNAILGFAETMAAGTFGPIGDRYVRYARDIHRAGVHLLGLINDLLDLSAIEAGQLALSDDAVDLRETVPACLRLVEDRAAAAGLVLVSHVPEDVPVFRADERRVRQMLINLLANAINYTPGPGRVSVDVCREGGGVAVSVADTGPGIPDAEIDRLMKPFQRSREARASAREGTGLGLPLVKHLAEMHGGGIRIESEVGRGTVATFTLPIDSP